MAVLQLVSSSSVARRGGPVRQLVLGERGGVCRRLQLQLVQGIGPQLIDAGVHLPVHHQLFAARAV